MFLNENVLISIKISLTVVPMDPINNIPTLVKIMAWRRPGKKLFDILPLVGRKAVMLTLGASHYRSQ